MKNLIFGVASLLAALSICGVPVAIAQGQDKTAQPSTEGQSQTSQPSTKAKRKTARRSARVRTVHRERVYRRYRHAGYHRYEYCPTCERAVNHSGCGYYNCYPPRERECGDSHCGRALLLDEDANLVDEVLLKPFPDACDGCEAIRY